MGQTQILMGLRKSDRPLQFLVVLATLAVGGSVILLKADSWVVAVIGGLAMGGYGGRQLYLGYASKRWPKIPRSIQSACVGEYTVSGELSASKYYYPDIHFSYVVGGKTYRSHSAALDLPSIWSAEKIGIAELLTGYPSEQQVAVYVDPSHPQRGVLFPGLSASRQSHFSAFVVGGTLIAVLGLGLSALL